MNVSGSGTVDTKDLKDEDVTIVVDGSGELEVSATGVLDVRISGSGRVRDQGTPRDIRKQISGSGTVEARLSAAARSRWSFKTRWASLLDGPGLCGLRHDVYLRRDAKRGNNDQAVRTRM